MEEIFSRLDTYGYIILFLYSFGGGFAAILAAGVLSYAGKMDLATSMAIAFTANVIGDSVLFYMSRYHKADIMGYLHKHKRKLALSHLLMKKHGSWVIIMQKFVYGIKTLIPLAIGLTKYDFTRFTILNILGAAIWTVVFGYGAYYIGETIISVYEIILERPYIAPMIVLVMGGGLWLYMERVTRKRVA